MRENKDMLVLICQLFFHQLFKLISPLKELQLCYSGVVSSALSQAQFKRGRNVPACTVELEWTGSGEPKPLSHQVKISDIWSKETGTLLLVLLSSSCW